MTSLTAFFFLLAIVNCLAGWYFITKGIEEHGKEKYLKQFGYYYGGWIIFSTVMILFQATKY